MHDKITIYGIEIEFVKDEHAQSPYLQRSFLSTKRRYLSVAVTDLQTRLQVNLINHFKGITQDLAHKVAKILIKEAKRKLGHTDRERVSARYHRDCKVLSDWIYRNKIIEA